MGITKPSAVSGMNMSIAQLWGSGPKWTITCGVCDVTFKIRVPMIDHPGIKCPNCGTVNIMPFVVSRGME